MSPDVLKIKVFANQALRKVTSLIVVLCFALSLLLPSKSYAEGMPYMPRPGAMVSLSPSFKPAHLLGLSIHPDNALMFDFLMHKGDAPLANEERKQEYNKLVKYFLASLTIPDQDQWVNLSPYEKQRIVSDNFSKTEMGRDLLAQDYFLKQITASLIYPENELGKAFWNKVYERAQKEFGSTQVPVNTFNKVWIVPDQAAVYESGNSVYILKSHLKVMLEEDYLSLEKNAATVIPEPAYRQAGVFSRESSSQARSVASSIVREIVLPELEREVNEGKNFAPLRQIYSAMILATWYKKALKESLLGQIYADKAKVKGVELSSPNVSVGDPGMSIDQVYQQYLQAFKKGVFNYIKEDVDKYTQEAIPRKYFSGGFARFNSAMTSNATATTMATYTSAQQPPVDLLKGAVAPRDMDQLTVTLTSATLPRTVVGEPLVVGVKRAEPSIDPKMVRDILDAEGASPRDREIVVDYLSGDVKAVEDYVHVIGEGQPDKEQSAREWMDHLIEVVLEKGKVIDISQRKKAVVTDNLNVKVEEKAEEKVVAKVDNLKPVRYGVVISKDEKISGRIVAELQSQVGYKLFYLASFLLGQKTILEAVDTVIAEERWSPNPSTEKIALDRIIALVLWAKFKLQPKEYVKILEELETKGDLTNLRFRKYGEYIPTKMPEDDYSPLIGNAFALATIYGDLTKLKEEKKKLAVKQRELKRQKMLLRKKNTKGQQTVVKKANQVVVDIKQDIATLEEGLEETINMFNSVQPSAAMVKTNDRGLEDKLRKLERINISLRVGEKKEALISSVVAGFRQEFATVGIDVKRGSRTNDVLQVIAKEIVEGYPNYLLKEARMDELEGAAHVDTLSRGYGDIRVSVRQELMMRLRLILGLGIDAAMTGVKQKDSIRPWVPLIALAVGLSVYQASVNYRDAVDKENTLAERQSKWERALRAGSESRILALIENSNKLPAWMKSLAFQYRYNHNYGFYSDISNAWGALRDALLSEHLQKHPGLKVQVEWGDLIFFNDGTVLNLRDKRAEEIALSGGRVVQIPYGVPTRAVENWLIKRGFNDGINDLVGYVVYGVEDKRKPTSNELYIANPAMSARSHAWWKLDDISKTGLRLQRYSLARKDEENVRKEIRDGLMVSLPLRGFRAASADLNNVVLSGPGSVRVLMAEEDEFRKGGIDLNANNLDLQIKRDGKGVPLPLNMQDMEKLRSIEGFIPVILNITPVTTLPILSELQQYQNATTTASAS